LLVHTSTKHQPGWNLRRLELAKRFIGEPWDSGELETAHLDRHAAGRMDALRNGAGTVPALEEPSPQGYGRLYVTSWETRNLRMAANIRNLMGPTPGMRTLVLVGASHKAYLDAYLDQMHDVRIIDVQTLLK
jgi:hypothetical protein